MVFAKNTIVVDGFSMVFLHVNHWCQWFFNGFSDLNHWYQWFFQWFSSLNHCHWMNGFRITIDINGFSIVLEKAGRARSNRSKTCSYWYPKIYPILSWNFIDHGRQIHRTRIQFQTFYNVDGKIVLQTQELFALWLGKPSNLIFGKIWEFGPTRSTPPSPKVGTPKTKKNWCLFCILGYSEHIIFSWKISFFWLGWRMGA